MSAAAGSFRNRCRSALELPGGLLPVGREAAELAATVQPLRRHVGPRLPGGLLDDVGPVATDPSRCPHAAGSCWSRSHSSNTRELTVICPRTRTAPGTLLARSKLPTVTPSEREDALAYLIPEAWRLSLCYQPGGTVTFSTWAGTTLRLCAVDWYRSTHGRITRKFKEGRTSERPARTTVRSTPPDWTTLSDRGQAILRQVAAPISQGYSEREIARELGISKRSVSGLLDELAAELCGGGR